MLQSQRVKQQFLKSFPLGLQFLFYGFTNEGDFIAHVEITVLGQIGEQAMSPTPSHQQQRQRHQRLVHRGHQTLAHETSNEITNPAVCTS